MGLTQFSTRTGFPPNCLEKNSVILTGDSTEAIISTMDALCNTHVKLLAFEFATLLPNPSDPSSFSRNGLILSRAESVGVVVTRDLKPGKFLRFIIDDGTGCVPCVLWLNQLTSAYFSRRNPSGVRSAAETAQRLASQIQLGAIARVRGRVTGYRGKIQITVSDAVLERDPNAQVPHWLDCVALARKCYDKVCRKVFDELPM